MQLFSRIASVLIRCHECDGLTALFHKFKGSSNVEYAEAKIVLIAIQFAVEISFCFLHVEGDVWNVVNALINCGENLSKIGDFIMEVQS